MLQVEYPSFTASCSHQVSKCRHENNGKCIFGSKNCWFIHEKHGNNIQSENSYEEVIEEQSDVMQKVFGMLEKMTGRIMKIEEKHNANQV